MRATLLILSVLMTGAALARGGEGLVPWERKVNLAVHGAGLGEAFSQINAQTGVTVQPSRAVAGLAGEIWKEPIYLDANDISLRQALELLSRLAGCRYRATAANTIRLDGAYEWLDRRRFALIITNVETLLGGQRDVAALEQNIEELTKILTLFDSGFYARVEEQGEQVKLVATVPEELKPLFERALGLLEQRGQSVAPPEQELIDPAERALIGALYKPVVAAYRARPLPEVVADLAAQAGVSIGFAQAGLRGGEVPQIDFDAGQLSLREAVIKLAELAGYRGIELSAPNLLWLGTRESAWEKFAPREQLWADTAMVRAYYVDDFAGEAGGEALAHQVRMRILPEAWLDPLASLIYHKASGNLLVVASEAVQREVYAVLGRYKARQLAEGGAGR